MARGISWRNMAIETTSSSPSIMDVTWMRPKFRIRPLISKKNGSEDEHTVLGKGWDIAQRVIRHRFDLVPIESVDPDFFNRRDQNTGYVYRQTRRGDAQLIFESFGNGAKGKKGKEEGAYQIRTSWLARHPIILTSFILQRSEWSLVTFAKPTENESPPERLSLPRKEKQRFRNIQPPLRKAA